MKKLQQHTAILTAGILLASSSLATFPENVFSTEYLISAFAQAPMSGICGADGDHITWEIVQETVSGHDTKQNILKITGEGAMNDWSYSAVPWTDSMENIDYVEISEGITSIGSYAFCSATNLKKITLPESITRIESFAFERCSSLTSIKIPDSITIISGSAFSHSGLKEIVLPEGLTTIEGYAFENCMNLEKITFPKSLTHIGHNAFSNTMWLTAQQNEGSLVIINDILYDGSNCKGEVVIPDGVRSIQDSAFLLCNGITDVTIPDSVVTIGSDVFYGCTNLENISISKNVSDIGSGAFYHTAWLTKKQAENPLVIVNEIVIDGTGCSGVVVIPEGITKVAPHAFSIYNNSSSVTKVTLPEGLISIGADAFSCCTSLKEINIPDTVTSIGSYAFFESGIEKITIPGSVEIIEYNVFRDCFSLTEAAIGEGVKEIEPSAFYGCTDLTEFVVPESVTRIGNMAFAHCNDLEHITFYSRDCEIEDINIEKSTKVIGYADSTAKDYAQQFGAHFESLDGETIVTSVTETTPVTEDTDYDSTTNCESYASFYIEELPEKLIYQIGEELDLTGGTVYGGGFYAPMGLFWDIFSAPMTDYEIDASDFNNQVPGVYDIHVIYKAPEWEVYETDTFQVIVAAPSMGDVDNSGIIDISDAIMLSRVVAEDSSLDRSNYHHEYADINYDNLVNAADVTTILKKIAKLI